MKHLAKVGLSVAICSLLSACGGGSTGGGVNSTPTPPAPVQFSNFSAIQTGASTAVSGITREGSVTVSSTGAILESGVTTPTVGTGSATFTLNSARQITGLGIAGAQSNVTFNASNSTSSSLLLNNQAVATSVYNSTGTDQALYGDPYVLGFNYQTFGVWGTGLVAGGTGKFGAMSVGAPTSASAVPTTGSVTYHGYAGGVYTAGAIWRYAANATFNANFANRTVDFSTSNQTITSVDTNVTVPTTGLQISGTMNYASGSSSFSGNLSATGTYTLTGTGSGTFYGPTANEIGGTFFLRSTLGTLVGGFGGKQ